MFVTRLISGIALVLIVTIMNIAGGPVLEAALLIIALIGLREFYQATGVITGEKKAGRKPGAFELAGMIGTILYYITALAGYYAFSTPVSMDLLMPVILLTFFAMVSIYVFAFPRFEGKTVMHAFFGFIYVPVMLHFIFMTRMLEHGEYLVWLIYIVSWVCDTCAYCVGMLLGRHKLAPVLSPKKSVEGAVGGILGSALASSLYAFILEKQGLITGELIWLFVLVGIFGSLISQIGDLTASAFKRNCDIKDYGSLIPGHGGILDRFDSVILAAPMIYFLLFMYGRLTS
ncbi:MAG: phosphatidate cytidylyltransferase [Lachnospiraceae bacterium]|nr:phosphatidate cytidylyltransferase [Lachnospiraceae bacterium]